MLCHEHNICKYNPCSIIAVLHNRFKGFRGANDVMNCHGVHAQDIRFESRLHYKGTGMPNCGIFA